MMTQRNDVSNIGLKHNRDLHIATAPSRDSGKWKNEQFKLSEFLHKLSKHSKGIETHAEFLALPKAKQDELKDVGGFVGGLLKGGRRNAHSVSNRDVITLDADYATDGFLELVAEKLQGFNYAIYSTRKHKPAKPRYRVLVFTDRAMFTDEYQAVARKLSFKIGIDLFDDSTYEAHRLMFWGSTCADVDYEFYHNDQPFISVDDLLAEYVDWQDVTQWHQSSRKNKVFDRNIKKLGDPKTKKGKIGAFCRVYDIHSAIASFLSDVYKRESESRYTYIEGTSSNGLVVYDDVHAYSNHSTDPAFSKTLNAFDLVRVHKFGDLDQDTKEETPVTKLPSFDAMQEFIDELKDVKLEMVRSGINFDDEDITSLFEEVGCVVEHEDDDWLGKLQTTDKGVILTSFLNAAIICANDPKINKIMAYNQLSLRVEKGRTGEMWKSTDSYSIRKYIGKNYNCDFPETKIEQAIEDAASFNSYHPIQVYLESLVWDGVPRVATMLTDWLGVEDNVYTRAVADCFMSACISRVYLPGYKFDTVPVLGGVQGIGKSSFIRLLAKDKYFSELSTYDTQKAVEGTMGKWIIELSELAAGNKHELEEQKAFITSSSSLVRMAYARHPVEFKRQFCLVGTTNENEYLKDSTGNRRFLPVDCTKELDQDGFEKVVDQLWAEAYNDYDMFGSDTLLTGEAALIAKEMQENKRVSDDWKGVIVEWLKDEADTSRYDAKYESDAFHGIKETRERVCIREIWEDCFKMKNEPRPYDNKRIAAILNNLDNLEHKTTMRFGKRFGTQKGWRVKNVEPEIPF